MILYIIIINIAREKIELDIIKNNVAFSINTQAENQLHWRKYAMIDVISPFQEKISDKIDLIKQFVNYYIDMIQF